ncbi:MAG TPA: spore coat protein U domain-containing protein [Nevskiales bacterium]|nr:spore coat protein U domain-containing protein [Nevskiales bacterium]
MLKKFGVSALAAAAMMGAGVSQAAEIDDLMSIQAEILAGCTSVDAPDTLDMGQLAQGAAGEAAGNILVTCGTGVNYEVAIEGGLQDAAGKRRMTNEFSGSTDFIPYVIVSGTCMSTTEVGTNNATLGGYTPTTPYTGGNVIAGVGDGTAQSVPVCAKVNAADTLSVPPDTYTDQVRVVVAF